MNGHFETNGIYPLSTQPKEGYGSDPETRKGKKILAHINGKFVKQTETEQGFELVADRAEATEFDDDIVASLEASKLLTKAREAAAATAQRSA